MKLHREKYLFSKNQILKRETNEYELEIIKEKAAGFVADTDPHKAVMEVESKQCSCQRWRVGDVFLHEPLNDAFSLWADMIIEPKLKLSMGSTKKAQKSKGNESKGTHVSHARSPLQLKVL